MSDFEGKKKVNLKFRVYIFKIFNEF
jgi:hypothetical protein